MVGDILQPTHLVFVLVVALLVLGPKRLPEVGRQLGSGLRDFRAAINGERPEPSEVQAPYEQRATETTPDHEFAHATAESSSDFSASAHESVEAVSNGHEFAHEPEASHDAQDGSEPDSAHEFAYETSESSDKPAEPLS